MPNSVKSIGFSAFEGCTKLRNVTIGNQVIIIDTSAFANCDDLENFYCNSTNVPSILSNAFDGSYIGYANLYVPIESLDAYKLADVWKDFGNIRSLSDVTFAETINVSAVKNVLSVGETETLTANVLPANATSKSVTWSSSNSDIVSVNAVTGEVTAVAYGSATITATAMDGSEVKGCITITVKAENYALTDGEEYLNVQELICDELTYTRTFNNTNWQALYVPFSMSFEDWDSQGLEVARLNGYYEYDDDKNGTIDRACLEVLMVTEGEGALKPNHPYMVRAKSTGTKTITLNNTTLYAAASNSIDCSTMETRYTFTGIYEQMSKASLNAINAYGMSGGSLKQAGGALNGFRWYMVRESREGQLLPIINEVKVHVIGWDDEEDGIETTRQDCGAEVAYNLMGQRVNDNSKGIIIKNGKKIIKNK